MSDTEAAARLLGTLQPALSIAAELSKALAQDLRRVRSEER